MTSASGILIIGGAGFIGSNFTQHVVDEYDQVTVLDKLTYAGDQQNLATVSDDITFIEGDVRNRGLLEEIYPEVDHVVNFAAESHVDRSIESGRKFIQTNVEGGFVAMDLLRDYNIDQFIQMSTDEVYGSTSEGKFTEDSSLDPSSPYSASKASADLLVNAFRETYDLPITLVRPTNVYGPRQHPEKLIPKFTLRSLREEPLPVYGDGSNVRQWLHVEDLCQALVLVLKSSESPIYNVGGTDEKTNLEVTKSILDYIGSSEDLIRFVEDRKGHDQRYALNDDRIRDELDFSPSIEFDEGLKQTVDWYKSNRSRYE